MYPLTHYIGETLIFYQPSFKKREYELRALDEVLAMLAFPKLLGNRAVVEIYDQKFEIKQPSFWRTEFGVYKFGYQMPFAKFVANFWKTKGTIELPKGARLNCKSGKLRKPFEIYSSQGELLIAYQNMLSFKGKTEAVIHQNFELLEKYPWIILLGFYVILLYKRARAAH